MEKIHEDYAMQTCTVTEEVVYLHHNHLNNKTMTQQDTNQLKFEIKRFVDAIGMRWMNTSWLDKMSNEAKLTLSEYHFDARILGKRDIAIMLYNNEDEKLWKIIMK